MRAKNLVVKSINAAGDDRCVDIFRRPDDTFGFEEYRRDVEDQRGWFAIGFYSSKPFDSEAAAQAAALAAVSWLREAIGSEAKTFAPE
ncbi:MAG: hypothetical protein ACKVP3_07365 [Hyphomicrobiaceae bacterium]